MVESNVCISCGTKITNLRGSVKFHCPNCGEYLIVRCVKCRKLAAKYTCPKCGFTGPN